MIQYQIDPRHTQARFRVRHMMIAWVNGEFNRVAGTIDFDPEKPEESHIEATIDATTVSTREPDRDRDLKSGNFLDTTRYPTMDFRSTRVVATGPRGYRVEGDLTIRGVTRGVTLRVDSLTDEIKDPSGGLRRGASAATRIQRRDFGLTWNAVLESGGFVVGDEVEITIDVELVRKAN